MSRLRRGKRRRLRLESLENRSLLTTVEFVVGEEVGEDFVDEMNPIHDMILNIDVDGDGDSDLARNLQNEFLWLERHSDGEYGALRGGINSSIRIDSHNQADLDGDGDLDIVNARDGWIFHWLNNGHEPWCLCRQKYEAELVPNEFGVLLRVEDFNADGVFELLMYHDSGTSIVHWNGEGYEEVFRMPETEYINAMSDFDVDGDLDLLVQSTDHQLQGLVWLENVSTPSNVKFDSQVVVENSTARPFEFEVVDMDGDRDLDVFLTTTQPPGASWLEFNTGVFSDRQEIGYEGGESLQVVDMDGDGDLDLLAETNQIGVYWSENVGDGQWFNHSVTRTASSSNHQAFDIDDDGDYDVLGTSSYSNMLVYENLGGRVGFETHTMHISARFVTEQDGQILLWVGERLVPFEMRHADQSWKSIGTIDGGPAASIGAVEAFQVADMDADDDPDIVYRSADRFYWMENNSGEFTTRHEIDRQTQVVGDTFVISGNTTPTLISFGDTFTVLSSTSLRTAANTLPFTGTADFNGDGEMDVYHGDQFYINGGDGVFRAVTGISGIVFDADLDGDVDVVWRNRWAENIGFERVPMAVHTIFDNLPASIPLGIRYSEIPPMDFDVDGDLDYYDSRVDGWGDGDGDGTDALVALGVGFDRFLKTVVDFDGDGDVDVVGIDGSHREFIWVETIIGEDSIRFTSHTLFSVGGSVWGRFLDIDSDGDLDVVETINVDGLAESGWLENLGPHASPEFGSFRRFPSRWTQFADINRDGNQDMVIRNTNWSWYDMINDYQSTLPISGSAWISLVDDFDSDGNTDILVNWLGAIDKPAYQIFFGDGTNDYNVQDIDFRSASGVQIVGVDFDADGDTDLFLPTENGNTLVLENAGDRQFVINKTLRFHVAAVADFDSDGQSEYLVNDVGRIGLARQDDDRGGIVPEQAPFNVRQVVLLNDYDKDNDLDILLSDNRGTAALENVQGEFNVLHFISSTPILGLFDADGDGHEELVTIDHQVFRYSPGILGDVNADGRVNTTDLNIYIANACTGSILPCSAPFTDGDVDGDGRVNTADLTKIIQNWTGARGSDPLALSTDLAIRTLVDPVLPNSSAEADQPQIRGFFVA